MAAPPAAEGQPARDADDRQIGCQARMLEDALAEHILKIRGVRHQKGAVKNGTVLLRFAVDQIPDAVERVDGTRILQKRQPRRKQQHAAERAAQHGLPCQRGELARADLVRAARQHTEKVDDEKDRLPRKKEVVVEQVHRDPEREAAFFSVQHGIVERCQHVGEQRYNVDKVVKEDIVHRKAGECVQAAGNHAPILIADPAARPEVGPAPREGDF